MARKVISTSIISILAIWLWPIFLCAQTTITGTITSHKGKPLSLINVMVYLPDNTSLISFGITNAKGEYKAEVNHRTDSLLLVVSSIQYRNEMRSISNKTQTADFILTEEVKEIKGVTVQAPMLERRGDTLSFLISTLAGKEDVVIEDVLKKIPGIEIEPNGQILYQGLPLQKFYVEGLDLMDGSYSVISKNLPHQSVSTVEIMENHQPVKILEDKVESSQASINIKLKNDVTITGNAFVGAGIWPLLWDLNVTPMIFTRKVQMVVSYQGNNTGRDVAEHLRVLTYDDALNLRDRPSLSSGLMGIQQPITPTLEKRRYLDNQSHYGNINALTSLNNDFQLRMNLFYINDKQHQKAATHRTLLVPGDTLIFTEQYRNNLHENHLLGKIALNRNVENNYFDNLLTFRSRWDQFSGMVISDAGEIAQHHDCPLQGISNELHSIYKVGDRLLELNSYVSYDHTDQTLSVSPGPYPALLHDSVPYAMAMQYLGLKRIYTDNSTGMVFSKSRFVITPRMGVQYRSQTLSSTMGLQNRAGMTDDAPSPFVNELTTDRLKIYGKVKVTYKYGAWTFKGSLPFYWQQDDFRDPVQGVDTQTRNGYFDPSLSLRSKFNGFWELYLGLSQTHGSGDPDNHYYGYLLRSYRNLSQNAVPLQQRTTRSLSLTLKYNNAITAFFNSWQYLFNSTENTLLYERRVNGDGAVVRTAMELPNTRNTHYAKWVSSKYFTKLKSTIDLNTQASIRGETSLVNGVLFHSSVRMLDIRPSCNVRVTNWFTVEYGVHATVIESVIPKGETVTVKMMRHEAELFAFPGRNHMISLTGAYYNHDDNPNYFLDFHYKLTLPRKISMELRWNNILNNDTYLLYHTGASLITESVYQLRPSQLILSVRFHFRDAP
ncbi:MAG: hypothetical protein CSA95_04885 [Bacteroidetes bacterium]|nr:MAG: hypothetical protein CSA95_04885 [Bacteroidota bacterium]